MKRFRYKGDLSKHIKRYHPGHTQPLTPVPLQEDELRSAFTAKHIYQTSSSSSSGISSNSSTSSRSSTSSVSSAAAAASTTQAVVTTAAATVAPTIHIQHPQQVIAVAATAGSGGGAVVAAASSQQQQGDNKFFLPLLPQHPLRPTELVSPSQHQQHKQSESKVILATSADGDGRLIPVQISSSPGGQKHITLAKGSFAAAAGSNHLSRSIQIVKGGGAVYTNHTSR